MISETQIDQVVGDVVSAGLSEATISGLRQRYTGVHFTYCNDDDICGPKPVRVATQFNVYLVDGRGHCLRFTTDTQHASGLVLAEIDADEIE